MSYRRQHSDEAIATALRRVARAAGGPPTSTGRGLRAYAEYRLPGEPSVSTIVGRFGSWNAALENAGLEANRRAGGRPLDYSNAQLVNAVAKVQAEIGATRVTARRYEEEREEGMPSGALVRRRLRGSVGRWREINAVADGVNRACEASR